jgi:cytochrome c oxidase subunit 2
VNLQIEAPQPKSSAHKETSHSIIRVDKTPAAGASYTNRLFSLSLVSSAHGASVETEPAQSAVQPRVINLQAKRFQYIPHQITVQKGELVTIIMESLDVTHGFYLDGYGVTMKARPGVVGKVTFVADKTGRFSFRCSETCGEFHPYMIGFLKVTPNSRFHLFVAAVCVVFVIALGILLRGARQKKGAEENAGTE